MHRKKEIIVIVLIILVTVALAFIPMIINYTKSDSEAITESKRPTTVNIKVTGELKLDEINIKIPYGYTYGYIINKIELYLNDYSVIDDDRNKRYYEDSTVVIETRDIKSVTIEDNSDKININTANAGELTSLYGIGDKRALLIIEYRQKKNIESFEELKELIGVSDEVIKRIKEKAIL